MVRDWVPLDRLGSAKVGPKGQIVIPKAMRDRAGMQPGAFVFLAQAEDGTITIRHAWNDLSEVPDYFARYPVRHGMEGKTALDILHEMDAEEEGLMERKYGPWNAPTSSTHTPSSPISSASRTGSASKRRSGSRSTARSRSS